MQSSAALLHEIARRTEGERARRAATGALVLRVVENADGVTPIEGFLTRRASQGVASLPRGPERTILGRLISACDGADTRERLAALVAYSYELEKTKRLDEADAALGLARQIVPECAECALHAGRVARKRGDHRKALALYRLASTLDREGGLLTRLARIGEAVVSAAPDRALTHAIREAKRAGDSEAVAVGLEERARVRRAEGRRDASMRDLALAALRFTDGADRARIAHELADVALGGADLEAAQEALLVAVQVGDWPQRDHARGRLHTLSRDRGDQVGMRRWRSFSPPMLVSLSARPRGVCARSAAARLRRWRAALGVQTA